MELLYLVPSSVSQLFYKAGVLVVFSIITAFIFDFMKRKKTWTRYPTGPSGVPFFGNLLQVDMSKPHRSFTKLSKQYGGIYSLQFGWKNIVVLNGFKAIKEALVKKSEDFADRPIFPAFERIGFYGTHEGIMFAKYDKTFKEQRRFALTTLRNLGMGKRSIEERVAEEAIYLNAAFQMEKGSFDPHSRLLNGVSNVICSVVFGNRFDYKDSTFKELVNLLQEELQHESGMTFELGNTFPWIYHFPGPHQKLLQIHKRIHTILRTFIEAHKETRVPCETRDYIDAFLEEIEKVKDENSSFNMTNLLLTAFDLFAAGVETTTTTLRWALLYMLLRPDIQSKVHEEIDRVIGKEKHPRLEDHVNLPFTEAVIHEVQRYSETVPLTLPHMTYRDTEVMDFFIPKGTTIIPNLSSALKDESFWKKPYEFYPENFLNSNGQFVKPEAFIPFSAGRRTCLGEQLAKVELFLFFTSLMQRFNIKLPKNEPLPKEEGYFRIFCTPYPFNICAELR
ncbi:cytochrome P450 2D15-like [Protopterus annectens]|uniref:cytochrome P450 2D15-like n=1 Tax=Protopterus annectens TaxID=7888 RepID=UPI001CFAA28B|nr:cytochrome P450 2D15-like [Protopterus annectens]